MNVFYNNSRLMETISDIYELTGIWINIHDLSGEDIHIRNAHCDFCRTINDLPEGHARCLSCDAKASNICRSIKAPYHYRCHAGMCETLVPIFNNGEVISYLGFGQLLDESPLEEQWNFTKNTLSWYPDDLENLRKNSTKSASILIAKHWPLRRFFKFSLPTWKLVIQLSQPDTLINRD